MTTSDVKAIAKTGEEAVDGIKTPSDIIKIPQPRAEDEVLREAYAKAGTLKVTKEEAKILAREFADEEVSKNQDGLLYIEHIYISERLTEAFGPGQWCVIESNKWTEPAPGRPDQRIVYGDYVLVVRGAYIAKATASHPTNRKTGVDDAQESCRSVALRRLAAKSSLGCGNQVWKKAYCQGS